MILGNVDRKISFTMAASSYNKKVIGDCAKMLNVIPVMRPEDNKIKGKGKIKFVNSKEIEVIFW